MLKDSLKLMKREYYTKQRQGLNERQETRWVKHKNSI